MKTKLHYLIIAILFGLGMNAQTVWLTGSGVGGWTEGGMVKLNTTDNVIYTKIGLEIQGDLATAGTTDIKFTEGTWATAAGYSASTASPGFPSGVTAIPGTNITATPGFWDVTYNYTTKEYSFVPGVNPNPAIAISGSAIGTDKTLSTADGIVYSKESMTFADGTAQFIQPGSSNTWSSVAFPDGNGGNGTNAGAAIPVSAGTYFVYFYRNTGDYSFQPTTVSIIGGFNGWGGDVDMVTTDNVTFTITDQVFPTDTALKFRDNHGWNFSFGSTVDPSAFPIGTGGGINKDISVPAGTYDITFNRSTLAYSFVLKSTPNPVVNITGTALAADVKMSTTDGVAYTKEAVVFTAGDVKFAEEGTANQWSDAAFPSGTGTQAGAPITVPADTFNVSFNKTTGAYSFDHLVISLVGGFNSWNGDVDLTTADGVTYTSASWTAAADTELKFRVNHGWATSYGSVAPTASSFPSGTAASSGSNNIAVPAGNYSITFDRNALTYSFTNLGVNNFASSNFKVYPNPTSNNWNFSSNNNLQIDSITVTDVLGKVVLVKNASSNEVNVDASTLTNGIYFAKVTANNAVQTIKVIKN